MKRIVILLLALTLTTGCAADPAAAEGRKDEPTVWKKPPALTVQVGDQAGQAALPTYSWTWPNGNGTDSGVEADGLHPLDMVDHVTPLPLGDERSATLTFELDGLALDQLTVRRWALSCAGDPAKYESDFELLPFTMDGGTIAIELPDGSGGVFEVHAYFTGKSHGDGYYAFWMEPQAPKDIG